MVNPDPALSEPVIAIPVAEFKVLIVVIFK
jgi:hypothetical protein